MALDRKHWLLGVGVCLIQLSPSLFTSALANHRSFGVRFWDRLGAILRKPLWRQGADDDHCDGTCRPGMSQTLKQDVMADHFCEIVDEFGAKSIEEFCEGDGSRCPRWIRLEGEPSSDVKAITSVEDVWKKIEEARSEQAKFGCADLYKRRWKCHVSGSEFTQPINGEGRRVFSIAQFNTLAEALSAGPEVKHPFMIGGANKYNQPDEKSSYGGFTSISHPSVILDFSLRRWRLLEVLLTSDGDQPCDILAVEEMDRFYGFFFPLLRLFGFDGRFCSKTCAPGVRMGWYSDGCGIFWKNDVFEFVSSECKEYATGNQVMLQIVLRHRSTRKTILIAVTHLKAQSNKRNENVRKQQVAELMNILDATAIKMAQNNGSTNVPILIVGDFNADPPTQCPFTNGAVETLFKKDEQGTIYQSAYQVDPPLEGFYTTWKIRGSKIVKRVIDYIMYRGTTMKCIATLDVPLHTEKMEPAKLPGLRYPSDHLLIAAKFELDE